MLKPKALSSVMVVLTPILYHSALHSLQTSRQNLYCITLSDRDTGDILPTGFI